MRHPSSYFTHALRWLLVLAPAGCAALLIYHYAVAVPQADEWRLSPLFDKFAHGTLTLADLFAQQNEYRQFFPNLVFVGLGWLTHGDVRALMWLSLLLAGLTSYNVYRLSARTHGTVPTARRWLFLGANLLIFSPAQLENWLQGQQLIYFVPVACLTTALGIIYSTRWRPASKFLLCAGLATCATFSAANGLLVWLVLLPALLPSGGQPNPARRRLLLPALWLMGGIINAALYFYDYHKPVAHPAVATALTQPVRALLHFLIVLGGPFGLRRAWLAAAAGTLLLLLFLGPARRGWRAAGGLHDTPAVRAWLLLGAYSVLTAALVTVGRVGFGVEQALSTRYTTFTIYLPVALLYLWPHAHLWPHTHKQPAGSPAAAGAPLFRRLRAPRFVVAALIVAHLPIYLQGLHQARLSRATQLRNKACVTFANIVRADCLGQVYPDIDQLLVAAHTLDRLGLLRPPLAQSSRVQAIAVEPPAPAAAVGSLQELTPTGHAYIVAGRAAVPGREQLPAAILLTYERAPDTDDVFALVMPDPPSANGAAWLWRSRNAPAGWHGSFAAAALPPGQQRIKAWAYDATTGRAYRLAGTQVMMGPTQGTQSSKTAQVGPTVQP